MDKDSSILGLRVFENLCPHEAQPLWMNLYMIFTQSLRPFHHRPSLIVNAQQPSGRTLFAVLRRRSGKCWFTNLYFELTDSLRRLRFISVITSALVNRSIERCVSQQTNRAESARHAGWNNSLKRSYPVLFFWLRWRYLFWPTFIHADIRRK